MLPQEYHIRFAEPSDFAAICAISRSVYGDEDPMPEYFNIWIQNKNITIYLLEYRGHSVSNMLSFSTA